MSRRRGSSSAQGGGRGGHDIWIVAVVVAALSVVAVQLDTLAHIERAIHRWAPLDELLVVALLLLVGLAVVVVRRSTQVERERRRRLTIEARYQALVEGSPAVTFTWDAKAHRRTYISPQIERLTGYGPDGWLAPGDGWLRPVHEDDRERVRAASARADATGEPFSEEYRVITRDGRTIWLREETRPVESDPDGTPVLSQGVMLDITALRDAESSAAEAEARFRTIVERVPAVAYVWDSGMRPGEQPAAYISPQIERLLGYTADEWLSQPKAWGDRVHADDLERVMTAWAAAVAERAPFAAEYRFQRADGAWVWIRDEANPVGTGTTGQPLYQGVMLDITERRLAEDRLREAEAHWRRLLERLPVVAFTIRHDLVTDEELDRWIAPGIVSLTGQSPEAWAADPRAWEEAIDAEDVALVRREREAVQRAGGVADLEYRARRTDGSLAWIREQIAFEVYDDIARADGVLIDITAQREAEEGFRGAEERYRHLIEQLPVAIYTDADDAQSTAIYISPRYEAITGYSPEQRLAEPGLWLSMLHPDDRDRVLAESERTMRTHEPFDVEYRIVAADARVVWVRDHATRVLAPDGIPIWQGVLQDITAEREAAEQTLDAERRYRGLIETIPAVTYIDTLTDPIQTLYVSPQIENLLGHTAQAWCEESERWRELTHPDDLETVDAAIEAHHREGAPYEVIYRLRHGDGTWRWVHDQATVVRDEEGRPLFSQGVIYDITSTKEAEDRLREAEHRYRGIVEHIPAAIYLNRPDETMQSVYVSPQIERLIGVSPKRWMDEPGLWLHLIDPDERQEIERSYVAAIGERQPWSAEYRVRTPDGRTIWVHDETTFLFDEGGAPIYLQGVLFDVTERKLAEEALRDSERRERDAAERLRSLDEMKNTFLAAVSHELRSPLTSILGLALTLERATSIGDEDRSDLLGRLAVNARKLDRLLKDLLDIDRLNRGIVEPQYRMIDVAALARRTLESLDALAGREVIVQTEPVVLSVDPPKIERIVENLLANAARHTEPDARIWLKVGPAENGVIVAVEDEGAGVPESIRAAIFEPFRQGPSAAAPHSPGTGIGLSLVARFAELHGGRAWVEERLGGGASFNVYLPGGRSSDDVVGAPRIESEEREAVAPTGTE